MESLETVWAGGNRQFLQRAAGMVSALGRSHSHTLDPASDRGRSDSSYCISCSLPDNRGRGMRASVNGTHLRYMPMEADRGGWCRERRVVGSRGAPDLHIPLPGAASLRSWALSVQQDSCWRDSAWGLG